MIPKIIHQIWLGDDIPDRDKEWCTETRWLNKGWEYHLWGQDGLGLYPSDPYLSYFRETKEKLAFVADRLRVLLLRDFGGVYMDADCQPVRKLDTLNHIWEDPQVDFVAGLRSPERRHVAVHRGIPIIDNTVFASAKHGHMAKRLCALYRPEAKKQSGYTQGLEVLRHCDHTTRLLNYRYWFAEHAFSETICLHDGHNTGSWVVKPEDIEKERAKVVQKV